MTHGLYRYSKVVRVVTERKHLPWQTPEDCGGVPDDHDVIILDARVP